MERNATNSTLFQNELQIVINGTQSTLLLLLLLIVRPVVCTVSNAEREYVVLCGTLRYGPPSPHSYCALYLGCYSNNLQPRDLICRIAGVMSCHGIGFSVSMLGKYEQIAAPAPSHNQVTHHVQLMDESISAPLTIAFPCGLNSQSTFCPLTAQHHRMTSSDQNKASTTQEDEKLSPTVKAARDGRADELAHLLESRTISLDEMRGLAFLATESMSLPTLQVLLDNGWDINMPESYMDPPYLG